MWPLTAKMLDMRPVVAALTRLVAFVAFLPPWLLVCELTCDSLCVGKDGRQAHTATPASDCPAHTAPASAPLPNPGAPTQPCDDPHAVSAKDRALTLKHSSKESRPASGFPLYVLGPRLDVAPRAISRATASRRPPLISPLAVTLRI